MEPPKLACTHACAPATVRSGVLWAGTPARRVTYASGRRVVLRHVSDLVPPRFYEHQYPVTVARISPNGQWVASATRPAGSACGASTRT